MLSTISALNNNLIAFVASTTGFRVPAYQMSYKRNPEVKNESEKVLLEALSNLLNQPDGELAKYEQTFGKRNMMSHYGKRSMMGGLYHK